MKMTDRMLNKKVKGCLCSSQSYGASPAIWDHTVLPATSHKWTRPALSPATQVGSQFTHPGKMEGSLDG